MTEFDMDPASSDLQIGLEVEYAIAQDWDDKWRPRGEASFGLRDEVQHDGFPSSIGGQAVHDGTVGLEIVSPVLDLKDAVGWYADTIEYIEQEYNEPFCPSGLSTRNTVGLHVHLSPLSRGQAERLYEISETDWAKALFCSTVVSDDIGHDWRVFRGTNYCGFPGGVTPAHTNSERHNCVNHRRNDHYEWRLPEPMTPDHLDLVVKFLRLFEQDDAEAVQYAQKLLDDGDGRITSIRRAEAVGMDIEEQPAVLRSPAEPTEEFYRQVESDWAAPEINRVDMSLGQFYVMESQLDGPFEVEGIEFMGDDVLNAESLQPINDPEIREHVLRTFRNRDRNSINQSEATEVVKDVVKKKKRGGH